MKKFFYIPLFLIFCILIIYFGIGFYIANSILHIDSKCGLHEGSLPNTWNTKLDHHEYKILEKRELRKNFPSNNYHLKKWENVYFSSREENIKLNGWLFNYFPNRPIVIIVHGLFPNGKCKPESNLIASLLIKEEINAFTIDLRNYGQSDTVSKYENLGLREYKDVLGAFDFLQKYGFKKNQIGLHGISLGGTSAIFAAEKEPGIKAIWLDSTLAEFQLILKDEIARYGFPHDFGIAVSFAGKILTGIDPSDLNPAYALNKSQFYFFTHGERDQRIYVSHYNFIHKHALDNNIKAEFWLLKDLYHVDSIFMYPDEYGKKMKNFFEKILVN